MTTSTIKLPTMASLDFSTIGDRQKTFEQVDAGRAIMPGIPVLARLDGRGFHNFTKGLLRPFDERMSLCMQETAQRLIDSFCADLAYTQSDEITLCWKNLEDTETKLMFGGKFQKLCSLLASCASVRFNKSVDFILPDVYGLKEPMFDCRVWQVPTLKIAAENFLWREMDARKNSVSMAASSFFSPRELHGKSTAERRGMLASKGINFDVYPEFFRKGTYYKRAKRMKFLTPEELERIPEAHRPTGPVERTEIADVAFPNLTTISNLPEALFFGETPILHSLILEESEPS